MSRFCPLFSSSKGNSIYLSGGDTAILVDVGVSFRRLYTALESRQLDWQNIRGIIITHEHTDHISGLKTLLKRWNIPVYSAPETLEYLVGRGIPSATSTLIPLECTQCIGDIEVTPFDTPHDAVHSIGLRFSMPDQRRIAIATDLGHITDTVRSNLSGCDLVMLESNYDPGMLSASSYPYMLKRRIKGETGHLSNNDCSSEVARLAEGGSTYFVLGHLSEQNNMPQLAYQTTRVTLQEAQMKEKQDYLLSVAPAHEPHEMLVF